MTSIKTNIIGLSVVLALGGCGPSPVAAPEENSAAEPAIADAPVAASVASSHSGWTGKWTGPEGLYVLITQNGAGAYDLEMQSDLDTKGTYPGQDAEGGITFERGGEELLLRTATGDETGLKYLAGKQDCLMVKTGEGYCRDQ